MPVDRSSASSDRAASRATAAAPLRAFARRAAWTRRRSASMPRAAERFHVAMRHVAPDHFAAEQVGPLAHRVTPRFVVQQAR